MISGSLGGVCVEAEKVIKSLNRMVAENQTPHMGKSQPGSGSVCLWTYKGPGTRPFQGEWLEGRIWRVREWVCFQGRDRF